MYKLIVTVVLQHNLGIGEGWIKHTQGPDLARGLCIPAIEVCRLFLYLLNLVPWTWPVSSPVLLLHVAVAAC